MDSNQNGSRTVGLAAVRRDVLASGVVFLVALPLCMGIALASGAPVATGLVTGIVGGLVVGFLAGSPLQVSGPAAGLTVICGELIRQQGLPALGIVVLLAGLLQLVAGLLRLGQWFRAVSPAVIHGMLSGIGVLILSSQLHVMVDDSPRESGLQNILALPECLWKGLPWPAWQDAPIRQARTELLQSFTLLHEQQGEIERMVQSTVTRHGSDSLHAREEAELVALAPRQRQVIEGFRRAVAQYRASPVAAENGRRSQALGQAIAAADQSLVQAAANLAGHRLELAKPSETAAGETLADVVAQLKNHDWAAKVGLLSIAVIVGWQLLARGRLKLVPAPLLAVLATTLLAWLGSLPVLYVEVPDNLRDGLTFPSWSVLEDASYRDLLVAAVMVAVIASAETLLCAAALDQMHRGPRTRYDRELAAQGIGNMLCGCLARCR